MRYPVVDPASLTRDEFAGMIDHTLLRPEATLGEYSAFIRDAERWGFRGVFVPPCYVPLAVGMLSASDLVVGTPVSFPFGYATPEAKAAEALDAIAEGAREIDMVMNISAALSGEWEMVEEDVDTVVRAVRGWEELSAEGPVVVKLILETPYLDDSQKKEACRRAVAAGIDFVKTATGLGPGGATVADVRLMKAAVGERAGVKASGGIRTTEDAIAMVRAGASRIGTSAGPDLVGGFPVG